MRTHRLRSWRCLGKRGRLDCVQGRASYAGPISDHAWNAGAYQGLLRIRDSLDARVSNIQVKTPADFEENFRAYGAQGYNLVFGHGFEFQDAASRVGPEIPRTVYITTSGTALDQTWRP